MRRRPVPPLARRVLIGATGAVALALLAACGSGSEAASVPVLSAGSAVDTTIAASTTSVTTTTVAPITTPEPTTNTTAPPTTVPVPVPTLAPIVTHDARVGVGVLTEDAVNAPVRVVIPSIGSDGSVSPTGVDETGGLAVPDDAKELVWWQYGASPGASGSAVIAGHVDWKGVLGTFDQLENTPVGELVIVTYADGTERTFVVTSVELVDKPAVAVDGTFARDGEPLLRLVTCGGEFDRAARSHRSNVILTAVPA